MKKIKISPDVKTYQARMSKAFLMQILIPFIPALKDADNLTNMWVHMDKNDVHIEYTTTKGGVNSTT